MCGVDRTYIILSLSRVRMIVYYIQCVQLCCTSGRSICNLRWQPWGSCDGPDTENGRPDTTVIDGGNDWTVVYDVHSSRSTICVSADGLRLMSDYSRRVASYNGPAQFTARMMDGLANYAAIAGREQLRVGKNAKIHNNNIYVYRRVACGKKITNQTL